MLATSHHCHTTAAKRNRNTVQHSATPPGRSESLCWWHSFPLLPCFLNGSYGFIWIFCIRQFETRACTHTRTRLQYAHMHTFWKLKPERCGPSHPSMSFPSEAARNVPVGDDNHKRQTLKSCYRAEQCSARNLLDGEVQLISTTFVVDDPAWCNI